jgi:subtilisin family serine protease
VLGASFQDALDYAFAKGALPVIAAGNNFVLPSGPIQHAIVVGALDRNGNKASYSDIPTSQWVLMAPGGETGETDDSCQHAPVGVLSTYLGGYACLAGTSMAAPHVSGAAALLRSQGYDTPGKIADRLLSTARAGAGAGALDVAAAAGEPPTPSPGTTPATSTTASDPATGATGTTGATASSTSSSSAPTGDVSGPSPTSPPSVSLPGQQRAAAAPTGRVTARSKGDDADLSSGVVVVAVVMAGGVSAATAWLFFRGHSWARRTPRLDR